MPAYETPIPNYRDTFRESSISHLDDYSVYANSEKASSVEERLFEGEIDSETGQFRYLMAETGIDGRDR